MSTIERAIGAGQWDLAALAVLFAAVEVLKLPDIRRIRSKPSGRAGPKSAAPNTSAPTGEASKWSGSGGVNPASADIKPDAANPGEPASDDPEKAEQVSVRQDEFDTKSVDIKTPETDGSVPAGAAPNKANSRRAVSASKRSCAGRRDEGQENRAERGDRRRRSRLL